MQIRKRCYNVNKYIHLLKDLQLVLATNYIGHNLKILFIFLAKKIHASNLYIKERFLMKLTIIIIKLFTP